MHFKRQHLLLLLVFLLSQNNYAQNKPKDSVIAPKIAVLASPQKEAKIFLRWAPTTPRAWRKLNEYGYNLKRYTVIRDGKVLPKKEVKDLGTFKPKPVEGWMPLIEINDNAAVVAQALYGEGFDVTGTNQLAKLVNLSEEQQQRFSWALYAADQDFKVAQMAGLGFIDNTVKANEKYLYKVIPLVPQDILTIKYGSAFTSLKDYMALPKPLDLAAIFSDKKVLLSWNYAIHKQLYNSYFVERSEDGKNFITLNKTPLTGLNNSKHTNLKRMFYMDSVPNNKTFYYRIKGRTAFGELSPPSETKSGMAKKILADVPRITNKNYFGNSGIVLEWVFPTEANKDISGFELNRADKIDGKYQVLVKNIAPTERKIKYDSLPPTSYMTITAVGKNGIRKTSMAALIQPVDSIPPAKPTGLEGTIDSLGIVTLKWQANKEKDMLGYRVFRGNNKNEEYSQITVSPHKATVYYDSISVKTLNSKVFYKIVAVDKRFNGSEFSDILTIKKPDFIPPSQPVITQYKIKDNKVLLTWANSSSEDVASHQIYRKDKADWQLMENITTQKDSLNKPKAYATWIDSKVTEGESYTYTIQATDESGLKSELSPALNIRIPKTSRKEAIKRFNAYADKKQKSITLTWKAYKEPNVAELQLYKGLKDKPITLMRILKPNTKQLIDTTLKPNNEYVYMLRAVFKDGSFNKMTKLTVKY